MSAVCWAGRHDKCTGRVVAIDFGARQSPPPVVLIRCECEVCEHLDVTAAEARAAHEELNLAAHPFKGDTE